MRKRDRLKELISKFSYEEKEVFLASGKKSNFYFDGKQTTLHPEGGTLVGELFFEMIEKNFPKIQAIGGPTLGADPILTAVCLTSFQKQKPLYSFIVRKEPKGHGTGAWIEGVKHLRSGMQCVLLEDVITTGGSLLKAADRVKEFGLDPVGVVVIVDRQEGGRENIEAYGMKVVSLFKREDF